VPAGARPPMGSSPGSGPRYCSRASATYARWTRCPDWRAKVTRSSVPSTHRPGGHLGRRPNTTYSSRPEPRLPVDRAHSLPAGTAVMISGARRPDVVYLTRWWDDPPFCEARWAKPPANWVPPTGVVGREQAKKAGMVPLPPSPAPGAQAKANTDELPVKWRGVPGQRRLHPPPPQL
jgi:hypothetical protein